MVWFIWSVVYSVNCLLTFFISTSNTSFSISACNDLQFKYYMFSQTEILIISSWNHQSLWLAAHSGLAPSLIDHKGSIIIIEQSQPRNHHNSSFAWMLSLPASHIRQINQKNTWQAISFVSVLPILAHLRHGAMRNCSLRPVKSSYSVVRVWKDYFLWTQYKYKQESTILLDDMFRTKSYDLSYHCQYKKSRAAAPYCGNYLFHPPYTFP